MAFAEADRVQIRRWLGFAPIYQATNPRLESAIKSVQSTADGGQMPDNSTELAVKAHLAELATIETRWKDLYEEMEAYKVEESTVDPVRGLAGLKQIGRMYVGFLSDALACRPMRDVFSTPTPGT